MIGTNDAWTKVLDSFLRLLQCTQTIKYAVSEFNTQPMEATARTAQPYTGQPYTTAQRNATQATTQRFPGTSSQPKLHTHSQAQVYVGQTSAQTTYPTANGKSFIL